MKKILLSISILVGLMTVSCEKMDLSKEGNNSTAQKQSTLDNNSLMESRISIFGYLGINAMSINNDTECRNNILIFPSWEKYYSTIETLEANVDSYVSTFESNAPAGLNDEQFDAYADSVGFNEDVPLIKFENRFGFCSLRKKLFDAETNWLANQTDGEWDGESDPDNDIIDDDTERTLLSENHEVIIGDKKSGYVIYKFTGDESYIEITNMDFQALQQINNGNIPAGNPNVLVVNGEKPKECKKSNRVISYFYPTSDVRIKGKEKFAVFLGNPRVKSTTKYFKKKRHGWKRGRSTISVKIFANSYLECEVGGATPQALGKQDRRHRLVVKWRPSDLEVLRINSLSISDNVLYGAHGVWGNFISAVDMYDGQY
jgi:hypothetical protein